MPLSNNVRRIVTTVDKSGKAVVLFDGDNPHTVKRPDRPTLSRLLWVTGESPADIAGPADRAAVAMGKIGISPPPGGSVFRIVDFPPIGPEVDKLDQRPPAPPARRRGAQARAAAAASVHAPHPHHRLRHHHGRRDRHAARRQRDPHEGRRRAGPAGHQSRLGQPRQGALPHRLHPDRIRRSRSVRSPGWSAADSPERVKTRGFRLCSIRATSDCIIRHRRRRRSRHRRRQMSPPRACPCRHGPCATPHCRRG